ncbi:hypothetical protein AC578_8234, partial [Pseudocercospora eumusae]
MGVAPSSPYELIAFKNTVKPGDALRKLWQGRDGFSPVEVQRNLRRIAITLYGHQELSSRYQSSMRRGRNTLLFFICAMHMRRAPPNIQETLSFKRSNPAEMVALYYFECLYYAIIHDIRRLQGNVEEHLSKHPGSTMQLHSHGRDCERSNDPFTMTDLAEQLEEFWVLLTDYRLLGPLETRTRIRSYADTIPVDLSKAEAESEFNEQFNAKPETEQKRILARSHGMYDAASMSTQEIYDLLWTRFAPVIQRGFPDLNIEVWIHNRESLQEQQQAQQSESSPVMQSGLAQSEPQQQQAQQSESSPVMQSGLAQSEPQQQLAQQSESSPVMQSGLAQSEPQQQLVQQSESAPVMQSGLAESEPQQQLAQQSEYTPVLQSGLAQSERQQQPAQAETNAQAPADDEDDSAPQYLPCVCHDDCYCRVACEYGVGECECHFRRRYGTLEQSSRNPFDAPTNEFAQLQVATPAIGEGRPQRRQPVQFLTDAYIRRCGFSSRPEPYRGRSTTIQNLHNVPEGLVSLRPARTPKDIYPLGLYNEQELGGRFPPFAASAPQQPRPVNSTGQATQSFSFGCGGRGGSPPQLTEAELPPLPFNSPPPATKQRYVLAGGPARLSERKSIDWSMPK